jgi:hypothetical protein
MAKDFSHAAIKARSLGMPTRRVGAADRTGLIAAGNPDVLAEAADLDRSGAGQSKLKPGPAWNEGLKNWGGVDHHPGKQDTPDISRGPVITK